MNIKWEQIEHIVYTDELKTENVHILELSKGNKIFHLTLDITEGEYNPIREKDTWYININNRYQETFEGTLEEAKERAIVLATSYLSELDKISKVIKELAKQVPC